MNLGLSLLLSLISGLVIIVGGWIFASKKNWSAAYLDFFIALGAGFILAVALLDMIPQAFASSPHSMMFVILGYLIVHLFEHVFTPHFHFGEETHEHLISHTVSTSALIGLMVHNFFSGVAIGSGMLTDYKIGLIIFFGTVLHKLPEGFTISSIMFASHHRRRNGVIGTILLALASLVGTVLIYMFEMEKWPIKDFALCVSAGTFIHIATTDLIPRINDAQQRWMPLVVFLGVGLFWASSLVFSH
jgi:zinc transporter ZupT